MKNISLGYEHLLNPKRIWSIKQNKPSLIAADFAKLGIPESKTHDILLARGVYKWLGVRRNLIKLKNIWKSRIKKSHEKICLLKKENDPYKLGYKRGYLKAYEECRKEIRALCHSQRWQAPDYDTRAKQHLKQLQN